jgi:hypothetical protein
VLYASYFVLMVWALGSVAVYSAKTLRALGPVRGRRYILRSVFSTATLRDAAIAAFFASFLLIDPSASSGLRLHTLWTLGWALVASIFVQLGAIVRDEPLEQLAEQRGLVLLERRPMDWRSSRWSRPSRNFVTSDETAAAIDDLVAGFRPNTLIVRTAAVGRIAGRAALIARVGRTWQRNDGIVIWLDIRSDERVVLLASESGSPAAAAARERIGIEPDVAAVDVLDVRLGPAGLALLWPRRTAVEVGYDELVGLATDVVRARAAGMALAAAPS